MADSSPTAPWATTIWTRELDGQPMAGRLHIAQAVRDTLGSQGPVQNLLMPSALSGKKITGLLGAGVSWLLAALGGALLPLQCALFSSRRDIDQIIAAIDPRVRTVYLDGIRLYSLLKTLRERRPELRIVVDLDDLLSRRARLLLEKKQSIAPGYVGANLPFGLKALMSAPLIRTLIPRYEAFTLTRVERDALRLADAVVLLSSADTEELRAAAATKPTRATIHNIPPSVPLHQTPLMSRLDRFVFIGSDNLTQNRLTIDYLLGLWRDWKPATPLVIYGLQRRKLALPPGVHMPGYAQHITDVYDGASALVTPSFVGGGVKTKVLEAFSHGAAVIGNQCTFESMTTPDYPLLIEREDLLRDLLTQPQQHLDTFLRAARIGRDYVRDQHSEQRFHARWLSVVAPETVDAEKAS